MKISVYMALSLDGFIARTNGDLDWLPGAEDTTADEDYGYKNFFKSVDLLVMGRKTFEKVLTFGEWPYGDKKVCVLSAKRNLIPGHLAETVRQKTGSPKVLIDKLKQDGFKHVYLDGGYTVQHFLKEGLVTELILTRVPILLGNGIPLFGALDYDIRLKHGYTQSFANGLVQSQYKVIK